MAVRFSLMLWNVGTVAVVLAALAVVVHYSTQATMLDAVNRNLEVRSRPFVEHWARFDRDRLYPPPWYRSGRRRPNRAPGGPPANPANSFARFWPRTLDTTGRPYLPWAKDTPWDAETVQSSARGERVFSSVWVGPEHIRVLSFPLYDGGKIAGVMQVASSLAGIDQAQASLSTAMLALSPLVLIAAAIVGVFMTGRAMRPVRTLAHAANRIGAGNVSERLPVIGNDDFAELAVTINGMLGRLEQAFTRLEEAFEQQRRFTADASHELRTPLTAIKGYVSLALSSERPAADYRKALEDTNRAADNMRNIVQELLFLARSDAHQLALDFRAIEVPDLLRAAVDAVRAPGQAPISTEAPEDLPRLCGDANHLERALVNLLINALRHTPASGQIVVEAAVEGTSMAIRVRDTGEGIAPEHLPHVVERFYRVDPSRVRSQGGTGLGLSIVQCIAQAHGGSLSIESELGVGTTVTIAIPLEEPEAAG